MTTPNQLICNICQQPVGNEKVTVWVTVKSGSTEIVQTEFAHKRCQSGSKRHTLSIVARVLLSAVYLIHGLSQQLTPSQFWGATFAFWFAFGVVGWLGKK